MINVINEGLIFHYDMNNTNSYLGKPTSNYVEQNYLDIHYDEFPFNEIVELEQSPGVNKKAIHSNAINSNLNTLYPVTVKNLQAERTYVMSCWYSFDKNWKGLKSVFYLRMYRNADNFLDTIQAPGKIYLTKEINGELWVKAYQAFTTPTDFTGQCEWYLGYPTKNNQGSRFFLDLQVEDSETPGGYLIGTRSPYESIIDLTGKNLINVNSLPYELTESSDFYWNGKTDFISLDNINIPKGIENFTYSCDITFFSKPKLAMIFENGTWPDGFFIRFEQDGISAYSMRRVYGKFLFDPELNQQYHLSFVKKDGQLYFYINGQFLSSFAFSPNIAPNTNLFYIGKAQHVNAQWFHGKISSMSIYNRALTEEEILINFNSSK